MNIVTHVVMINLFIPFVHFQRFADSKVHGANMGTTWVLSAPDGPRIGPMNLAIRVVSLS